MVRFNSFALLLALMGLVASAATAFVPTPGESATARASARQIESHARESGAAGGRATLRAGVTELRALVLRVAFSDTTWDDTHPDGYFEDTLFGDDPSSLRSYLAEVSGGRLNLTGDVAPLITLDESIVTYTGDGSCSWCCCGISPYPFNSQALAEDIVAAVDSAVDFSQYDGDGDGEVDALFVVHAGLGQEDTPTQRRSFRAHQWHTVQTPVVDGVRVTNYVLTSRFSRIGVFAHEMLHLYGVPDLYDLDGTSVGLGNWSLMAAGALLGSPSGSNPAHPDPWTRILVGFASPVFDPFPGTEGALTLDPVETGGDVILATEGKEVGDEFFLLEHRSRTAGIYDREIPGEGLLIYHVDLTERSNETEFRYRVALEQADGLYNLEDPVFINRLGDDGDPFPGSSEAIRFADDTTPSSRTNDGDPTSVTVSDIVVVGDRSTFTLRLADTPRIRVSVTPVRDVSGSPDIRIDPGETWTFDLNVGNGGTASPATTWTTTATAATIGSGGSFAVPALGDGDFERFEEALTLTVLEREPADRTLDIQFESNLGDVSETFVDIGDTPGYSTSFEAEGSWTAEAPWHRTDRRATDGSFAFRFGSEGGDDYPPNADATLELPRVWLGARSVLRFHHWIDAESALPNDAFDGGRVEVSTGAVPWFPIEPIDGYTHQPFVNPSTLLVGSGLASGVGGWEELAFDLSALDGLDVALRFRFATDVNDADRAHEGWYVDDVRIETVGGDVGSAIFDPTVSADSVEGGWTVVPLRRSFAGEVQLVREDVDATGGPAAGYMILQTQSVDGRFRATFTDEGMAPATARRYALIWTDPEPDSLLAERMVARPALPVRPAIVAAGPNPMFGSGSRFVIELAPNMLSEPRLRVFDATGRWVADGTRSRLANEGHVLEWAGRAATGRDAPAGVYFYRVEPGGLGSGRVVLVR